MTDLKQKTTSQPAINNLVVKGKLSYSELPTTDVSVGDTYIITDRDNLPYVALQDINNNIIWVQLGQLTTGYSKDQYSYIFGQNVVSVKNNQFVIGKNNSIDTAGYYSFILGNGSSSSSRKNSMAIDSSGNLKLKGTVYIGANDDSSGGTNLVSSITARFG